MKHVLTGMAAFFAALYAGAAASAMSPEDVSKKLAQQYGVKVLRVTEGDYAGKKVFKVTVMGAPGNANTAFEVATLAVDPDTGNLLPAFRHTQSGYELSGAEATNTNRNSWGMPESGRAWR